MNINEQRSARWLRTFAQIMEVDRQRPLRAQPAPKLSLPEGRFLARNKGEEQL